MPLGSLPIYPDTLKLSASLTRLANNIGVFQGSCLGSLHYSVFSNDLSLFAENSNVIQYADDTQVLVSGKKSALPALVSSMETAMTALDSWFRANSLKVNANKTQIIVFGNRQNLQNLPLGEMTVTFRGVSLQPSTEVKILGIVFDSRLFWDQHISLLTRRCFGMLTGLVHLRHYPLKQCCQHSCLHWFSLTSDNA